MQIKIKKIYSILMMLAMFAILGFMFSSKVYAWMPATMARQNPTTGVFPQKYLEQRTIHLPNERYNFTTKQWVVNITGGYVHCGDQSAALRTGKFDSKKYYNDSVSSTISIRDEAAAIADSFHSSEAPRGGTYTGEFSYSVQGRIDLGHYILEGYYSEEHGMELVAQNAMKEIMGLLSGQERITPYSPDIDPVRTYGSWNGDPVYGPKVGVMETSTRAGDGYKKVKSSTFKSSNGGVDSQVAYALTALENVYGTGKISEKYTKEDIQTAFWMLVDPDGKNSLKPKSLTENGKVLYNKTVEYSKFLQEISGGYNVTVNSSEVQVIANQSERYYIVGPFSVHYPDHEDISYIKSMYITNGSQQLIVDEQNQQFEIICKGGTTSNPGSNGITKIYPKSNEPFFIKFYSKDLSDPTKVKLGVNCEYLSSCSAEYHQYESTCNIYQYIGHTEFSGENAMNSGRLYVYMPYEYLNYEIIGSHTEHRSCGCTATLPEGHNVCSSCGHHHASGSCGATIAVKVDDWGYVKHRDTHLVHYMDIYQPFVKMKDKPVSTTKGQRLFGITGAERKYEIVEGSTEFSTPPPPPPPPPGDNPPGEDTPPGYIDLTFTIGGTVWVDAQSGKETIGDSNHGTSGDILMSNVPVTLYNSSGAVVATTKTNSKGEYRFAKLNAMDKYYVKFTYNSQYYQPVEYVAPYGGKWETNSNGTDKIGERDSVNARFASIGSTPENYTGKNGINKTYTREELLNAGAIDQFGNLIGGDASMQKFVTDCQLQSYTGYGKNNTTDYYPVENIFVIDTMQNTLSKTIITATAIYPKLYHINQGYTEREQSDLAIKKDVEKVTLEINGQKHVYTYDTLENQSNAESTWDINVRLSDAYYNKSYSRELYTSDYLYKVSNYGTNFADYGKVKSDELEVYVTYKVMIRNQAMSIQASINEIVDYYDSDLQYMDERSYIEIKRGNNSGKYLVQASDTSRYGNASKTTIAGYDNLYIRGLSGLYLEAGQTAYVYLTFRVEKDSRDGEEWVRLDEEIETASAIGVGKENIVEINGYSTRYASGTQVPNVGDVSHKPAGIVDRDSNPGNLNPSDVPKDGNIKYERFEDDTDKAPNIRIILNRDDNAVRVISGFVWEDERNETIGLTTTGDGIKDKTLINGVTVQLVELMENGTEYIWRTFENGSGTADKTSPIINAYNLVKDYTFNGNHDGAYAFKSFMPGKYVVRFIYGDTVRTVTPSSLNVGGLNSKSYNGQDFKSTTYQQGIAQNKVYTWREKSTWANGQETLGKILTEVSTFKADASNNETANAKTNQSKAYLYDITASDKANNVSDAKDIESRRNEVINYSDNDITNYIAEVLASHKSDYETMNDRNTLLNDLMANTKMVAETGLMVIEFEYDTPATNGEVKGNTYKIQNVDLGLEERPKSQLVIDKEVTNVKLTLADGSILFDAKNSATNVLWKDHKEYLVGYKGNFMDEEKFGNIQNIRNKNSNKFGLIQLSMDEELMHGATMEITYKVTVSNVGEVDYKDNLFYYTGNKSANAQIVKTKANQVIDYVANNLQFNASNNSNWKVISKDEIKSQGLVNAKLNNQVDKYNTIIVTENLGKELIPELADKNNSSVSVPLVLTQLITSENDSDDLTYRNLVEIVKTSNLVGRRMEYSVVGNQDPESKPQELDTDIAEVVRILPPFGNAGIYIIITIVSLIAISIVIVGTIFIKKKVLRK